MLKYSSSDTYFENNQGFKQAELLVPPIKAEEYSSNVTSFLSRNVNSPYIQQHRGFKTLRSRSESTPFRSEKEDDLTSTEELIKRILKKGNPTKEEMEQITNMLKDVQLSQDEKKQVITWVFFRQNILTYHVMHSVEITYGNLLSHIFDKNFVKVTFLLKS